MFFLSILYVCYLYVCYMLNQFRIDDDGRNINEKKEAQRHLIAKDSLSIVVMSEMKVIERVFFGFDVPI